jgi:hypothetical protein
LWSTAPKKPVSRRIIAEADHKRRGKKKMKKKGQKRKLELKRNELAMRAITMPAKAVNGAPSFRAGNGKLGRDGAGENTKKWKSHAR